MTDHSRVRRLDAHELVGRVDAVADLGLSVLGPATGGNVGAAHVVDRHGDRFVLTWQPGVPVERHRQVARLVEVARSAGIPAPRYAHVLQVGEDVAVLQELLPGAPPARPDEGLVTELVGLNDRFRGLLAGRTETAPVELHLLRSGPGFCLHEPLVSHSAATRRLLDRVHEIGRSGADVLEGVDLVHLDYQPANVLLDESGRLTGVVDWDGAGRGDAGLDLVVLLFDLLARGTVPVAAAGLGERVRERLAPDRFRACWAHIGLRMVDWSIRHHGPTEVDRHLEIASTGLD